MPTENAVLEQIRQQLEVQGQNFRELPELRDYIDISQRYQDAEREARLREIKLDRSKNAYVRNADGQVVGLQLYLVMVKWYVISVP